MDGLPTTFNYHYAATRSRNTQPRKKNNLPYLILIQLRISKTRGEEVVGLFTVKGRMIRIAVPHFATDSHIIQVVHCTHKKKEYLQDCCTGRRKSAK